MMLLRSLLSFLLLPLLALAGTDSEGLTFLLENGQKPGVVTLASGLQYKVLKKGDGKFHPTPSSPCLCHYEGRLLNGKVFDSSYKRGEPTTFAPNQVIKGWLEAMQLMVEGDKLELYIMSELAYGDQGAGADIPGGAVLIFEMELVEITGDKVPALTCSKSGEGCNEKETAYLEKMKDKPVEEQKKQYHRLNGMLNKRMADELVDWVRRRIHILANLIPNDIDDDREEGEL